MPCSRPQLLLLPPPPFMSLAVYSLLTPCDSMFSFRVGGGRWTSRVEVSVFKDDDEENAPVDELDLELASPSSSPPSPTQHQHLARTTTGHSGSTLHGQPGCRWATGDKCRGAGRAVEGCFACSRLLTCSLPNIVQLCNSWGSSSNVHSKLVLAFILCLFMWVPAAWSCSFGLCLCSIMLICACLCSFVL